MDHNELIPHLFRTEYRKIVSVLCRRFGFDQIETAEDIAGDTFLTAAQTWSMNGIPENPVAWLYHVAKNKAKNVVHRKTFFTTGVIPELMHEPSAADTDEIDLSPAGIIDSQLQMMFAVCHPSIPPESQIALSLRILCGFGIDEIAGAFLTTKETINKRLFRAKEKLREENIAIEFPNPAEIDKRLETVLRTIYLLFNEGYYSTSSDTTLRKDLCLEAMRLCTMLVEHELTDTPQANALLALMCFHASRFDARIGGDGEIVLYEEQDESLWNTDLIGRGGYFLHRASTGSTLTKYHLEAAIAYWNTQKSDTKEKWDRILQLYNQLLQIEYSPVAALNRTYALFKANGREEAIIEAEKLQLTGNQFYYALLGELYRGIDTGKAKSHFEKAFSLARTEGNKRMIQKKIDSLPV
jgi:RNA polymerase sigma-70 factor (ECF subfamily)